MAAPSASATIYCSESVASELPDALTDNLASVSPKCLSQVVSEVLPGLVQIVDVGQNDIGVAQ